LWPIKNQAFGETAVYESMLERANMPSLELSRIRLLGIEVFKAINKLSNPFICDLLKSHFYDLRNSNLKN
jgi:hypothetical protein